MKNLREELITKANDCVGTPFLWGGNNKEGFDCSGLMQYLYAEINIDIPRTTYEQINKGKEVSKSNLKEGDLLFFGIDNPNHVAMYMGNNQMLEAPYTGKNVRIVDINRTDFMNARRILS